MLSFKLLAFGLITLVVLILIIIISYQFSSSKNDDSTIISSKFNKKFCNCGNSIDRLNNQNFRISNGTKVAKDEFSWGAIIFEEKLSLHTKALLLYTSLCSGSVINPSYILTAAHCFGPPQLNEFGGPNALYVAAGLDHNIWNLFHSPENKRKVSNYYYHPLYHPRTQLYDIAIVRLVRPFEFSSQTAIMPGCFRNENMTLFDNLIASGHGISHPILIPFNITNDKINKNDIYSFNNMTIFLSDIWNLSIGLEKIYCKQVLVKSQKDFFKIEFDLPFDWILTKCPTGSLCKGDSGGPLMTRKSDKFYIVGVANGVLNSRRNGTHALVCYPNDLSISIPIYPLIEWIRDHVGEDLCLKN